jgi:hypothetical protein
MKGRIRGVDGFLAGKATARVLFAAGALLLPAFLFQQDPLVRGLQFLLFLGLNAAAGRRTRVVQILLISAGIVAFNLVIPTGRVLLSVLGLPITEIALRSGLQKATAVVGMIAISQLSLRADLEIPGRLGGLIGRSLFYFQLIMSRRSRIDRRNFIESIDDLLIGLQGSGAAGVEQGTRTQRTTPGGAAVLSALVFVNWAVFVYTLLRPYPLWGR